MVDDYAVIGGQVGIGDKVHIESRAVLGSGCGVLTSKIVRSGEVVCGYTGAPTEGTSFTTCQPVTSSPITEGND